MSNMGRPKIDNPKDVKFNIYIDRQLNEMLIAHIEKTGASRSEVMRRALRLFLEQNK